MGTYLVLCRRAALRRRDDSIRDHVQAARYFQYRHRSLHELAVPTMGYQAILEPVR